MSEETHMKLVKEFAEQVAQAEQKVLAEQLTEFISRGLIIIKQVKPSILKNGTKIEYTSALRFELKDQEYIEQLESQLEREQKCVETAIESLESLHETLEAILDNSIELHPKQELIGIKAISILARTNLKAELTKIKSLKEEK